LSAKLNYNNNNKMVKGQKKQNDDRFINSLLRPNRWADYIGQEKIKKNLRLILEAAKRRNESSDHLLFCGPAGPGKTTLAVLAAKEIGGNLKTVSGSNRFTPRLANRLLKRCRDFVEVYEPHFVKMGFIQRTPKDRMVSKAAYEHLQLQEE